MPTAKAKRRTIDLGAEVWTADEVAEYLRISPRTVQDQAVRGIIPGFRLGSIWRFHRSKIIALAEGKVA